MNAVVAADLQLVVLRLVGELVEEVGGIGGLAGELGLVSLLPERFIAARAAAGWAGPGGICAAGEACTRCTCGNDFTASAAR